MNKEKYKAKQLEELDAHIRWVDNQQFISVEMARELLSQVIDELWVSDEMVEELADLVCNCEQGSFDKCLLIVRGLLEENVARAAKMREDLSIKRKK